MRKKQAKTWHRGDRILDKSGLHAIIEDVKTGTGPTGKPVIFLTLAWSDGFTTVHYSSVAEGIIRRGGKLIPAARDMPPEHSKTVKHLVKTHPKPAKKQARKNVKWKSR